MTDNDNRINYIEEKLNHHIFENHQFQLKISTKLAEVSTKVALWAGLPSILLLVVELAKIFIH